MNMYELFLYRIVSNYNEIICNYNAFRSNCNELLEYRNFEWNTEMKSCNRKRKHASKRIVGWMSGF